MKCAAGRFRIARLQPTRQITPCISSSRRRHFHQLTVTHTTNRTTPRPRATYLTMARFSNLEKTTENPSKNAAKTANLIEDISEALHLPRQRDLSFYLVLLLAVLPLWSVVPLSWAFVIYSLRTGSIWSFTWKGHTLFAFALVEV